MSDYDGPMLELEPLTPGEASALSYFIAFAAVNHALKDTSLQRLTEHEESMIEKVIALDPDGYEMWREAIIRKHDDGDSVVGVPEAAA